MSPVVVGWTVSLTHSNNRGLNCACAIIAMALTAVYNGLEVGIGPEFAWVRQWVGS